MIIVYAAAGTAGLLIVHNLIGKPIPFLRWSFIRLALSTPRLMKEWQVGDGREEQCAQYVAAHAKKGDIHDTIRAIDEFAYKKSFLINVGDRKGAILDNVIQKQRPMRAMELGCYVGYSALRIASKLPAGGHLYSIEFSAGNAQIARRIVEHAGASDRISIVHGFIGDGGKTMTALRDQHGFKKACLDVLFIDHAKEAYLPDLQTLMQAEWLHPGTVVVADNVRFPGAPAYKAYMEQQEGKTWKTISHDTYAEYQTMIPDIVLESTLI